MTPDGYTFRPMSVEDLPMVGDWLAAPHVAAWWGDPYEQLALITEDLGHPAMDQFIIMEREAPLGYLQCYTPTAWNAGFGPQPDCTRGIDLFIGWAEMIDRGHGSILIRAFVDSIFATGTPRAVTDPDPGNHRALRVYEKAGFRKDRLVETPDGRALLMVRDA